MFFQTKLRAVNLRLPKEFRRVNLQLRGVFNQLVVVPRSFLLLFRRQR